MRKLSNSVLDFTVNNEERKLGYEKAYEYFTAYRAGKATKVMHEDMNTFLFSEMELLTGKERKEIVSRFMKNREFKEAAFEVVGIMIDAIMPDVIMEDYGWLVELRNMDWGDSARFDLKPYDMFVSSKIGKDKRTFDIQMMESSEQTLLTEWHGITVGVKFYDVLTGKITLGEWMAKALEAMQLELKYQIWETFVAGMEGLTAPWKVTNYTQDSAVELSQRVSAWNGGAEPIFLGTKLALSRILPATTTNQVIYSYDKERISLGYFRDFYGTKCVELPQIADYKNHGATKMPNDRIFVICPGVSDKMVKVVLEGTTLTNVEDTYDGANLISAGTTRKSWGVGLITSAYGGVITL